MVGQFNRRLCGKFFYRERPRQNVNDAIPGNYDAMLTECDPSGFDRDDPICMQNLVNVLQPESSLVALSGSTITESEVFAVLIVVAAAQYLNGCSLIG